MPKIYPVSESTENETWPGAKGASYWKDRCLFYIVSFSFVIFFLCFILVALRIYSHAHKHPYSVSVSSTTVSPFNISSSNTSWLLTATWNISFSFQNPSSKTLHFETINVSVSYGDYILSRSSIPQFSLQNHTTAASDVLLEAYSAPVDGKVADSMLKDVARDGSVDFGLNLLVRLSSGKKGGNFGCGKVTIWSALSFPDGFGAVGGGKFTGPPQKCHDPLEDYFNIPLSYILVFAVVGLMFLIIVVADVSHPIWLPTTK